MRLFALALGVLAMVGCGGSNPLHETALGITAATSIGRSVQLAMLAVPGTQAAGCVQVTQACSSYPCDGAATVSLGGDCPLPLGGTTAGTVSVTGHFTSASDATLAATFTNVTVGNDKPIALATVTAVTATQSGASVKVTYAGENAGARSGVTAASVGGASSWTVDIDTKGTAQPGDDTLTVTASNASATAGVGTTAKAATLDGVVVDPSCTQNPIGGTGQITEVSGFIPNIENISFHAACDGKGVINGHAYEFDVTP